MRVSLRVLLTSVSAYRGARYHALYIEMKKPGSYQRPEQKEWQKNCEKYGNKYVVCKSLDQFRDEVNNYLNEK